MPLCVVSNLESPSELASSATAELSGSAGAMSEALFRPGAAAVLAKRGTERLREFTWRRSADRLLSLFRSVVAHEVPAPQPARALAFPLTATRPVPMRAPGFAAHVMRSH